MTASLDFAPLSVPFRGAFRHASAVRAAGASLRVSARRGPHVGLGEGCPRDYVTGESVASCCDWLGARAREIAAACVDLPSLRAWAAARRESIDVAPSAWCAVECALLDLFAREAGQSVEALLGLPDVRADYGYTAVLGDDPAPVFRERLARHVDAGFVDYKLRLGGDAAIDRGRIEAVQAACAARGVSPRIRVDANNLWAAAPEPAGPYLAALAGALVAVEEPVAPRDVAALARVAAQTGLPLILDESARRPADLARFDGFPGPLIVNVKVSKAGGPLRALELVAAAVARGHRVVVGAHVGETSILTRAALPVARAAGTALFGHEGAYGIHLLEREPVAPCLMFGRGGRLELASGGGLGDAGWGLTWIDGGMA